MDKIYKLKIKMLKDEYWYGGLIRDGLKMPYINPQNMIDLSKENHSNLATSLFVSTQGRYIYSQRPFKYTIKNKLIVIESTSLLKLKETKDQTLKSVLNAFNNKYLDQTHDKLDLSIFDGPQYNTWMEMNYNSSQEKVLEYAKNIVDNNFPTGLLMIDDNWQKAYGDFEFDKSRFSNPKRMIEELHDFGFKVSLWVCPFISADSLIFRELEALGYLVKDKDNNVKIIKWWNGYSACLDLTNPKAYNWLYNSLKKLQKEYKVDGFKFDACDFEFYNGSTFYDGTNQCAQAERYVDLASQFAINELRVAFNGQNKEVVYRLTDKNHSWKNNGLDSLIPDTLSASMLGYKIICPDMIGGGNLNNVKKEKIDQELFIRYCQIASFFPIMQFSMLPFKLLSASNLEIIRKCVDLHQSLVPYIKEVAKKSFETGEPIIKSLEYAYPHKGFEFENESFMLGDKYIVVPMLGKGKNHKIFKLPEGNWKNEKGVEFVGGKNVPVNSSLDTISYFEKAEPVQEQKKKVTRTRKKKEETTN